MYINGPYIFFEDVAFEVCILDAAPELTLISQILYQQWDFI